MLGTGRVSELVVGAGGTDGKVLVFDLRTGEPVASHTASADTLNGFQFHSFLPLAATASGAGLLLLAFNTAIVIPSMALMQRRWHVIWIARNVFIWPECCANIVDRASALPAGANVRV